MTAKERVERIKKNQPRPMQLIIDVCAAIEAQNGTLEEALDFADQIEHGGPDFSVRVLNGKHTLLDFCGLTAEGILANRRQFHRTPAEARADLAEIATAFMAQGMTVGGWEPEPTPYDVQQQDDPAAPAATTGDGVPVVSPADTLVPTPVGDRRRRVKPEAAA